MKYQDERHFVGSSPKSSICHDAQFSFPSVTLILTYCKRALGSPSSFFGSPAAFTHSKSYATAASRVLSSPSEQNKPRQFLIIPLSKPSSSITVGMKSASHEPQAPFDALPRMTHLVRPSLPKHSFRSATDSSLGYIQPCS